MDREQQTFDELTIRLSRISDQTSAEFNRLSGALVKSQNKLTLLISRNMHCFQVVSDWQRLYLKLYIHHSMAVTMVVKYK